MRLLILLLTLFAAAQISAQTGIDTTQTIPQDTIQTDTLTANNIKPEIADSVAVIKKHFDAFEYGEVIKSANRLLQFSDQISKDNLIQIYRMKGISHYTLTEDQAAKESFLQILRIDSAFALDSAKTSPKIISYFQEIRNNFILQSLNQQTETVVRVDTVMIPVREPALHLENHIRQTLFRSIIFPGLGHLYDGRTASGWILTSLTALSLGSTIYFTIDSNKKEERYLSERNPALIEVSYKRFNDSYTYRNVSIAVLAAVWLYSQLDLFLFGHPIGENEYLTVTSDFSTLSLKFFF